MDNYVDLYKQFNIDISLSTKNTMTKPEIKK